MSEVRLRNTRLTYGVSAFMSQARDMEISGTSTSARIGYTRVFTVAQTLDQQTAALQAEQCLKSVDRLGKGAYLPG